MKLQVSVTEPVDLIKEVQMAPARIFEVLGMDIRKLDWPAAQKYSQRG